MSATAAAVLANEPDPDKWLRDMILRELHQFLDYNAGVAFIDTKDNRRFVLNSPRTIGLQLRGTLPKLMPAPTQDADEPESNFQRRLFEQYNRQFPFKRIQVTVNVAYEKPPDWPFRDGDFVVVSLPKRDPGWFPVISDRLLEKWVVYASGAELFVLTQSTFL